MTDHMHCLVLPSTYRDSLVLMKLSATLQGMPGVLKAAVMMGTQQNKVILQEAGLFTSEGQKAGANDLLVCLQGSTPEAVHLGVEEAKRRLSHIPVSREGGGEMAPRTLETALQRMPGANLACISVPGQYARREAQKALENGLHVFLFSDHVDLGAEKELKELAARQGLLLMGPECGTAIVNGVPLGFANQVPRGPVGMVSASGTGLQEVACLLAQQGMGISQGIGVGGRDLHRRIGGHSMRAALQMLARDEHTKVIVLISKAPDVKVADLLAREAAQAGKPCVLAFLGSEQWPSPANTLYLATTLEQGALVAGALARDEPVPSRPSDHLLDLPPSFGALRAKMHPEQRTIHGLYCGGTLAYEALWLLRQLLGGVKSNLDGTLNTSEKTDHVVLDLGAEEFTIGRPHPMIDPESRRHQLLALAARPEVAVLVCDVILGWGAHPDPASALTTAWKEAERLANARGRHIICIAALCGTRQDPQGYDQQCRILQENGIILTESNAQAVRLAASLVGANPVGLTMGPVSKATELTPPARNENAVPEVPAHLPALLSMGPRVINLGLELFASQLRACAVPVIHVDWRPPAGGDTRLASLLERLR